MLATELHEVVVLVVVDSGRIELRCGDCGGGGEKEDQTQKEF